MELYIGSREDTDILTGILTKNGYIVGTTPLQGADGNSAAHGMWLVRTYEPVPEKKAQDAGAAAEAAAAAEA